MLLTELTGIKSQKGKTAYEILNLLKKEHGIKMASGSFGMVLTHPSWDHVVKFFAKDDCYMTFVDFCLKHKSPHLPAFKKKPTKMSAFFKKEASKAALDKFYVVKIEKLQPLTFDDYREIFPLVTVKFREQYQDVIGTSKEDEFLKSQKVDPKLKDLANIIFELFETKTSGCFMDLHEGNFMKRGDTFVIVDPYAGWEAEKGLTLDTIMKRADIHDLIGYEEIVDQMADEFTIPMFRDTKPLS